MCRRSSSRIRAALLASAALAALGADLPDPTRPALWPPPPGPGAAPAAGAQRADTGLESVFISETRRFAVVDGRRVEVGDRLGDARVIGIGLSGVRLRGGRGPDGERREWLLKLTTAGGEIKRPAAARWDER